MRVAVAEGRHDHAPFRIQYLAVGFRALCQRPEILDQTAFDPEPGILQDPCL